jgi:serine/threonine protein kinase
MKSLKSIRAQRPTATADVAPYAGQLIGERYRLEEWLESGAMGSVWRAEQVRLRSPAAVKFLDPSLIEFPEMHDRFLQEARSAAAVQSAHVIQIFDYGREAGIPYIAMELLRGENLDTRLARRGLLTPRELNKIFSEIARGLGAAHALGVVHRDVKPGNIFIERQGRHEVTKLIDFGIAKVQENALRISGITGTVQGTVLGTPQYMSPEQLRGRSSVDYRTDLWALGIIACECLTGRHPFPGTTIGDLSVQICTEQPPPPSSLGAVPAGFDAWFFKAISKDPLDRFESAATMADALTKILLGPRKRESATLRARWSLALPDSQELRRAWVAGSRRALSLASSGVAVARALGGVLAQHLRQASLLVADLVRRLYARHVSGRVNVAGVNVAGAALIGSILLVFALVLWLPGRASAPHSIQAAGVSDARLAASPRELPSNASPAPREEEQALPVLQAEELPPLVGDENENPSQSAPLSGASSSGVQSSAVPRRSKKRSPPSAADDDAALLSPMSIAMGQLGARIAQGGEQQRHEPKPASPRARKHAER